MFLTIFVCALLGSPPASAGAGSCKPLPLPQRLAEHQFVSFEECTAAGFDIERVWLYDHRDWQEGGVRCMAEQPK
jgi:hypothetical protein